MMMILILTYVVSISSNTTCTFNNVNNTHLYLIQIMVIRGFKQSEKRIFVLTIDNEDNFIHFDLSSLSIGTSRYFTRSEIPSSEVSGQSTNVGG